ncbi:MAG: NAD(P)-dependent oxidoreductase [Armatimonadetes bacterium]|nr:NAD(P)-dependent oxidoreductase [Armatimonadota bacterium]MDW8122725.1 NAD(P)-dependent oxidoreductase [Armatimonadota bacterium]
MRVLLTGAAGKIGRAAGKRLVQDGHAVIGLDLVVDRDLPFPIKSADVTNPEEMRRMMAGVDAVVHLAAIPGPRFSSPYEVFRVNLMGTFNVLESCRMEGVRKVVIASSINAVGLHYNKERPRLDYLPIDERHPARPEEAYSLSKWLGELAAEATCRLMPDLSAASLRFHGVVSDKTLERFRSEPIRQLPGDYKGLWGYVHIDDVVGAIICALKAHWLGHHAFFICASDTHSAIPTRQLIEAAYPDVPLRRALGEYEGLFDLTKAKTLMGWSPKVSWRSSCLAASS